MKLFAISDLHLPGGDDKPMNVFGSQWDEHFLHISEDWLSRVGADDAVLIAGDISWALQMKNAEADLMAIAALPGRKVLLKGNHDYWWTSATRIRGLLPEGTYILQHSALDLGEAVVCGTRGWNFPSEACPLTPEEEKIYTREVMRMEMALREGAGIAGGRPLIVMTHFPPLSPEIHETAMTELFHRYGVRTVVYGHLHGQGIYAGVNGVVDGVAYYLTSCDSLGFRLAEISPGCPG